MPSPAGTEKIHLPQWGDVYYAEEVTSTNDVAAQMYQQGAPYFTVIWADAQMKGRGRLGRKWKTYRDVGLAFSVVVPEGGDVLPLMMSVCLHRAFRRFAANHLQQSLTIKWPNDILIGTKKLAGILIESHTDAQGERFYVVGIGLNVQTPPQGFDETPEAVALENICHTAPERSFVLAAILQELKKILDLQTENHEDANIITYYQTHCDTIGQSIIWQDGKNATKGTAKNITAQGHLILSTDTGDITCHVGEVVVNKD